MQIIAPECLDDKVALEIEWWFVETKDNKVYGCNLEHCPKCDSYLTTKGMKKDLKNAALEFINNSFTTSYELSDIVKIEQ